MISASDVKKLVRLQARYDGTAKRLLTKQTAILTRLLIFCVKRVWQQLRKKQAELLPRVLLIFWWKAISALW